VIDVGQARIFFQPGEQGIDPFAAAGHGAVDAFFGQQQRAFDAVGIEGFEQGFTQRDVVRQGDELVQRRHDDLLGHAGTSSSGLPTQRADRECENDNAGVSRRGAHSSNKS
jgi:hypothetical protein